MCIGVRKEMGNIFLGFFFRVWSHCLLTALLSLYICIYMCVWLCGCTRGGASLVFNCFWGSGVPALVLFLFYVNVSGMHPQPRLSLKPLTILAPWVFLRVRWSIPLFLPWVAAFRFLLENERAELKPTTFSSPLLLRFFLSFLFS